MAFSGILKIPSGISPEWGIFCQIWQCGMFFPLNFSPWAQFCSRNLWIPILLEFLWNSGIHSGILKNWLRVWYGVSIPLIFKHWVQFYCHNWQFYKNEGIEEKNIFINKVKSKSISNFFNCVEIRMWALNLNSAINTISKWTSIVHYNDALIWRRHGGFRSSSACCLLT